MVVNDLQELAGRIGSALDRADAGFEAILDKVGGEAAAPVDSGELDSLRAELEEERTVTAQLQERIKGLRQKQEEHIARLSAQLEDQSRAGAHLDQELQRLLKANEALRASNQALRDAATQGVAEPHLINKAMLSELEGMRAARGVEAAEAEAIMAGLKPLLLETPVSQETANKETPDA